MSTFYCATHGATAFPAGEESIWCAKCQPEIVTPEQWQPIAFGPFVPTGGTYMDLCSWTDHAGGFWLWDGDDSQPTHWMPLPDPPSSAQGSGE